MSRKYYLNQETQKIELRDLSKEEYLSLGEELKKEVKRAYLIGKNGWVSRSKNNHYNAIRIAEKLGFTEQEIIGERLSFVEEIERQKEKAEARSERYEQYAENAEKRRESLQSEFNEMRKDWSFLTQPNINSAGGRAFTNYREKIINRYQKGFEEYRKSEYFKNKARTAEETANMSKFKDKAYLDNKIKECNKNIKTYEKNIIWAEENNNQESIERNLSNIEYEIDKLAYLENCLDELGGITFSRDNIKAGYLVKIRRDWELVIKANKTTVEVKSRFGSILKYIYAEVQEVKIPENYVEPSNELENPYKINDILVHYSMGSNRVIKAYQVLKVTAKGVQIQQINIDDNNKPIPNGFKISSKPERKGITKSKYSDFVGVYDGDWQLYKYDLTA